MKLSDFVKNKDSRTAPAAAPAAKPKVPSLGQLPPLPPLTMASRVAAPPADLASLEKKITEKVETQFQQELDRIREKMERDFQARMAEERRKFEDQEIRLRQAEAEARTRAAPFEKEKSVSSGREDPRDREAFWVARMDEERRKFRETFEQELGKAQEMIRDLESRILSKAASAAPEASPPVPEKVILPPVGPRSSKMETPAYLAAGRRNESQEIEEAVRAEELQKLLAELQDSRQLEECLRMRDELLASVTQVFEFTGKGVPLDMVRPREILSALIDHAGLRDFDIMRAAIEPYPAGSHFACHGVNVAMLSIVLGLEFQFSREDLLRLGLGALFHDIGLANIREDLNYPKKLTPHLEKDILQHPERGYQILKDSLEPASLEIILQHHEVANGKGYPRGLVDADISLFAKIVHIVDSFEALIHERPYRTKPLEVHDAIKQLIDAGRMVYDRRVLKALMVRIGLYPVMTEVELSNKQRGRVIRQNPQFPLSPLVLMEQDETGASLSKPMPVDLSRTQFVHIVGPVRKGGEPFESSHFAPLESPAKSKKFQEVLEFAQGVVSFLMLVTAAFLIFFIVLKV